MTELHIHESKHGALIGAKGATLQKLKDDHKVAIELPKKGSGSHVVVISGEAAARGRAQVAIEALLGYKVEADTPLEKTTVEIPPASHGKLIGKGGANLKQLQTDGTIVLVPEAAAGTKVVTFIGYPKGLQKSLAQARGLVGETNFRVLDSEEPLGETLPPFQPLPLEGKIVEALFFPEPSLADGSDGPTFRRFLHYLVSASISLDVCVFTITDDRISRAIIAAHHRGVTVRVITDDEQAKALGSDIDEMRSQGLQVRQDDSPSHMHHKFAILDGKVLLNGSYNWTRNANLCNNENITILSEPLLVKAFLTEFNRLWTLFPPMRAK